MSEKEIHILLQEMIDECDALTKHWIEVLDKIIDSLDDKKEEETHDSESTD